jgi:hypothetical protein
MGVARLSTVFVTGAVTVTVAAQTVTPDAPDVAVAPRLSVATAVTLCEPIAAFVQLNVYFPLTSVPTPMDVAPFRKNSTFDRVPSLSVALACNATVSVALNVALLLGALSVIVGAALTTILNAVEVFVAPVLSVAFAVKL